jgi:PAS domain S-box-containing protein
MAGDTILVVDAEDGTWADDLAHVIRSPELRLRHCPGAAEAARCVHEMAVSGAELRAVVITPDADTPLAAARQIHQLDPLVQIVFLADEQRAAQLRREMGPAPRIGTYWSIAPPELPVLAQLLQDAARSTQQRRQSRTTLDRVKLQVASRPSADSPDYRKLILSDRYLASILNHAQDAILSTEPNGKILTWNKAATALFGYREQEILRRPLAMLAVGPDETRINEILKAVRDGRPEVRREMRLRRADGSDVVVEATFAPVRDEQGRLLGISAIIRDMTERKRAEDEVREQREWLRVTLDSIGDAVIATDTQRRVTLINPVAESLTGWSRQEAVGRSLEEVFVIVNEQTRQSADHPVAKVLKEGVIVGLANHTVLIARDGAERPIDDSAAPIRDSQGHIQGVVMVFRDVTERRQMEFELQARADRLVEADRRKDEFIALLGHELRNPLAPLYNGLQILELKGGLDPLVHEIREMMERQVRQLTRLVDDLLDVSRINRGLLRLQKERVELSAIVTKAIETTRPMIDERRHELSLILPDKPVWLHGDPVRIEQILWNLLTNAARYTEPGGRIRISAKPENGFAVVRVADTGIGIRPEMLTRIFDTFTQADRATGRVHEGLGLGLPLVQKLVTMHGGSVEAVSEGPGQGSEFIVRIPAHREVSATPAVPDSEAAPVRNAKLRVLIVDDNIAAAETLGVLLQVAGHDVQVAHDGLEALEKAEFHRPECVFLDIGLPHGMDGYEVARRLRRQTETDAAFLIALTGFGQDEDRRRAKEAGFDAHLVKPAATEAVQELLARAAQRRRG